MSNGTIPAEAPANKAELTREYVSGGTVLWSSTRLRTLPHPIDDLTQDLGDDLYDRILYDPQASGAVHVLKTGILEDGCLLASSVTQEGADGFAQAQEIAAFCTAAFDELDIPLDDVLWNLLDAIAFGNKIGELVYRQDGRWLMLRAIKVKPRRATAFVVDQFMNVLGLVGRPGLLGSLDVQEQPTVLPLEKFAVYSFHPRDSDPRGTSILRPAYNAWWLKMQTWGEFLKFLTQFASPSLWGTTPEGAKSPPDDPETPQQKMLAQLLQFRNGTAAVFPAGANLDTILSSGEGQAFHAAFELYGREIVTAILNQTRAILEAQHGSRADSETSQDVLDTLVRQTKKSVVRMIRRGILRPLVRYNFGDAAVALTPLATLGNVEEQDRTGMWNAIANLARANYFDVSQLPAVDTLANLPPRAVSVAPVDAGQQDQGGMGS